MVSMNTRKFEIEKFHSSPNSRSLKELQQLVKFLPDTIDLKFEIPHS